MELQTFAQRYGKLAAMEGRDTAPQERELVARAQSGDSRAFQELMEHHLPQVWRVVWRVLRHQQDAEDVVQEVFLAAYRGLAGFRSESLLSTWLHRIAVNRALNHRNLAAERMRRASTSLDAPAEEDDMDGNPGAALPSEGPSPLQELESQELKRRLAWCMEKIPSLWRATLALREGESLSYEEIAQRMDIALGTVRSRLARARLALRRCVEREAT
jgi:RNA polymerase sigma-70 factor (ECF subfamily)